MHSHPSSSWIQKGTHWILLFVLSCMVYLLVLPRNQFQELMILKPLPIFFLLLYVRQKGKGAYGFWIQIALVFSMIGDVFLIQPSKQRFLLGLISFLFAHIAFIVAFWNIEKKKHWIRMFPFLAWILAMNVLLFPTLKGMKIPVAFYSVAIMLVMWRAAAQLGMEKGKAPWLVTMGAILFAASDSLIAINRFYQPIPHVKWFIVVLYLLGQLGMVLSIVRQPRGRVFP